MLPILLWKNKTGLHRNLQELFEQTWCNSIKSLTNDYLGSASFSSSCGKTLSLSASIFTFKKKKKEKQHTPLYLLSIWKKT